MAYQVKVQNGALDEHNGNIILRGVIDPSSFGAIQVDWYQREQRAVSKLKGMIAALKAGKQLPDIEIGVRGGDYTERSGNFFITPHCYVVDGLQRLTACIRVITENPQAVVRLGAMFHFNTNAKWERDRFEATNGGDGGRIAVSPNVLLRNSADSSQTVATLIKMCANDKEFVLRGKVSWGQNKGRTELLTALTVLKTIGHLHSHFGPGKSNRYSELMRACDKTIVVVGVTTWRANVREFFGLVDQAFGISQIRYVDLAPQIKFGFLRTLAQVLADHSTFWVDSKLAIDRRDYEKLRGFKIADPGIVALIGSGGGVNPMLYRELVNHMNSGRRTNRLVKWNGEAADGIMPLESSRETDGDEGRPEFADTASQELAAAGA